MKNLISVIILATALAGCAISPPGAHFSKTGDYKADPREEGCEYSVYTTAPKKEYEEVGVISYLAVPHALPRTIDYVRTISNKEVCASGGNGLLLWEANGYGGFTKGIVIYLK